MVRNPKLSDAGQQRGLDEGFRLAHSMVAKWRVGVIIRGHLSN